MSIRYRVAICYLFLAAWTQAQDQGFTPAQIQQFEQESLAKSDLSLAQKVLQEGRVELLLLPLSDLQVAGLSCADLRILRNAIFAKYGYRFQSADLTTFFSKFSWYEPRTSEIPSAQLTKAERFNVSLLLLYEKGPSERELSALTSSDLVGMWHAAPAVGSGYSERLFVYGDGRFEYAANQMDGTNRLVSVAGKWRLEDRYFVVEASSETYRHGGTIVPPYASWGSEYVIDDGEVKTIELAPPLVLRFPLSVPLTDGKRALPHLFFGAREYWKLYTDPDRGRD